MKNLRKILAIVLAVCFVVSLAACGDSSDNGGKVNSAKWQSNLKAPGDVFELPDVKSAGDKAPVIAEITKQVTPGSSFTVTGTGFDGVKKAYVYAQNEKGNGKVNEAKFVVADDTTMMITVSEDIKYGVYGVYVENANGTSNLETINVAKVWWNGLTTVTSGDEFSLYGENFTTDNGNKTFAYLVDDDNKGRYRELEITYSDPYKVTVKIPEGLEDGKQYSIKVHNGHGGEEAWAVAPEKIKYIKEKPVKFDGKKIDVTEYGANPADDKKGDSKAIQSAVDAASDGDIIYIPKGVYLFDTQVNVSKVLKFEGEGADKVKFVNGNYDGDMLKIKVGPSEVSGIAFTDIRQTKLQAGFVHFTGDSTLSDIFNFYVHDCTFAQTTSPSTKSQAGCVIAQHTSGVIIKNNKFKATQLCWSNDVQKIFITDNDYAGTFYVGDYYNQNATLIWHTDMMEASNNKIYGMDKLSDDSGHLKRGDYTAGRAFAIQGDVRNVYISNNKIEHTGLPADNAGEQIMLEGIGNEYYGGIAGATENSITLQSNATIKRNAIITIVNGTGVTQWRYVEKSKGKELFVSEPWDIIPGKDSIITVTQRFDNYAIYNNVFDGFINHPEAPSATCAVQLYGPVHNCFITNNIMKNMPYGVCVTSHYFKTDDTSSKNSATYQQGIFWTQIENNKIEKVSTGIRFILETKLSGSGKPPMLTSFGVVVKNNEFKDIVDYTADIKKGLGGAGIMLGTMNYAYTNRPNNNLWAAPWENGTLIENNTFINNELANIELFKHQGNTVLRNNKVDDKWPEYTVMPNGVEPIVFK